MTRKPFGSVSSTGFGNATERGGAGGGGVPCGVCAWTPQHSRAANKTITPQRRNGANENRKNFAPARLCGRNSLRFLIIARPPCSSRPQAGSTTPNDSHRQNTFSLPVV